MPTDPFDLLGIPRSASADEVKEAYRALAKRWHPDRFANRSAAEQATAHQRFIELQEAKDHALALVARGGPRRRHGARRTPPPPPPPPPTPQELATQLVEQLVAGSLRRFQNTWRGESIPVANLANRIADEAMRCEPDIARTNLRATNYTELAALCLTVLAMEPTRRIGRDPLLAEFARRVAVDALQTLNGGHPLRFYLSLATLLPDVNDPQFSIGTPGFCLRCLGAPAVNFRLRTVVGRGLWHRWEVRRLHRCAACTVPTYREVQARELEVGWWGLFSFFLTPIVLASNSAQLHRARRAKGPQRPAEFSAPAPGLHTWQRGRPLQATFGAMFAATFIVLAIFGATRPTAPDRGSASATTEATATPSTTAGTPPSTTTTKSTTTTIPPVPGTPLSKTLATFKAAYGKPVKYDNNFGPVIRSAGARAPTLEGLSPSKGPVDHFVMNFPNGTTELMAAVAVGRFLPNDVRTTYRKEILHYNNKADQLVGDCLAWNLHSPTLTERFLDLGMKKRRFIAMVFTSSTLRNRYLGVFNNIVAHPHFADMGRDDITYRPENVTRVEVWMVEGAQPRYRCYDPGYEASSYYDPSYDIYDSAP